MLCVYARVVMLCILHYVNNYVTLVVSVTTDGALICLPLKKWNKQKVGLATLFFGHTRRFVFGKWFTVR
jgi:hypothetical protein